MKKKKGGGGGANWMDTYGDMVTLLLCFFVLLYSMSTISEDKWKALVQSFNPNAIPAATEIEGGNNGPSADSPGESGVFDNPDAQDDIDQMMKELADAIEAAVAAEGMESTIQVEFTGGKVYVSFSNSVFFLGDSSVLQPAGQEILSKICLLLNDAEPAIDEIRVQGHTAQQYANQRNEPQGDYRLAANRAIEVVLFLQDNSTIHPARMIPESFGQWRPIGNNKDEAGRAPNRRVEMIISGVDLEADTLNDAIKKYITTSDEALESAPANP